MFKYKHLSLNQLTHTDLTLDFSSSVCRLSSKEEAKQRTAEEAFPHQMSGETVRPGILLAYSIPTSNLQKRTQNICLQYSYC